MSLLPAAELARRLETFVADQQSQGAVILRRTDRTVTMRFPSGRQRTLWIDHDGVPAWSDDGPARGEPEIPPFYCAACGTFGRGRTHTPGHFLIEVVLWLCLLLPGVIYSLWRLSARRRVCAACGAHVVPSDTPVAIAARRA